MARKYAIRDQNEIYFVTFTVVHWIDVFVRGVYCDLFVDSLKYCQKNKGLEVWAYCIMSSHVHLIIGTNGQEPLQSIIRDLKSYTSRHIRKLIEDKDTRESRDRWMLWMMQRAGQKNSNTKDFQFWQQHNHPIVLDNQVKTDQRLDYPHNNPVESGLVQEASCWKYSSAAFYNLGETPLLPIRHLYG